MVVSAAAVGLVHTGLKSGHSLVSEYIGSVTCALA